MNTLLINGLVLLFIYFAGMVTLAQIKQDTSIVNFTWGGGCMLIALYTLFAQGTYLPRQILLTTLICMWCIRLAVYVYIRYTGKDPRFATWRTATGLKAFLFNIFWVYGLQTCMVVVMSIPTLLVNLSYVPSLTILDFIGLFIWITGFIIESISDYQLYRFIKNPAHKGSILKSGLWRYSRHPNYFGESVMWWGIYFITLSVPYGFYAIITPLTVTILLRFVTGVPWIEQVLEKNPEFQKYKKETNIFIPWFVKK